MAAEKGGDEEKQKENLEKKEKKPGKKRRLQKRVKLARPGENLLKARSRGAQKEGRQEKRDSLQQDKRWKKGLVEVEWQEDEQHRQEKQMDEEEREKSAKMKTKRKPWLEPM